MKYWKVWINGNERGVVAGVDYDSAKHEAQIQFKEEYESGQHFKITPL